MIAAKTLCSCPSGVLVRHLSGYPTYQDLEMLFVGSIAQIVAGTHNFPHATSAKNCDFTLSF
jgi:hypothetical protein